MILSIFIISCGPKIESSNVKIKRGYKKDFSGYLGSTIGSLTEIIPKEETASNWTSMFTMQFMEGIKFSAKESLRRLSKMAKKNCGEKFNLKIIREESNSVTFEWSVRDCKQIDFMKHVSKGIAVDNCDINYFTGLIYFGSQNYGAPSQCKKNATQTEIARFIKGNDGLHRVSYTEKTENIDPIERKKWLASLENAYIKKDGKKVVLRSNKALK